MPRWLTVLSVPAATLLAFAIQYALLPDPDIAPFVFFFFAVALAAWVGGRSAGLATAGLSGIVGNFAFVHPHWGWSLSAPALLATGLFLLSSCAVALVCGALRHAVEQAQRSAEARRQTEELNRRIIESSPDCVKVLDLDGNMLSMSPGGQRLLEIEDLASVLRSSWAGFWSGSDHDGALAALATARAGGTGRLQGSCPTAKGTPKWWDVLVTAIVGPDGRPERLLAISRDVTERRHAEEALQEVNERLREADRRKDEFLAMLSHELRNPLTPIRNSLYVLEHAAPGGNQARQAQAVIDRQVGQLARLVDDLLDVTRISRGKIRLQRERVDLVDLMRRVAEDHRSLFERGGVALELRLPAAPLWLTADPQRLAQAVGNLLQNAAKFTGSGGHTVLTVAQSPDASAALLTVRDSGVGITAEMLPRLFEPFAQADTTLERSGGGLGLGLALVKGIVGLHAGSVAAHSDGAGAGAELTVRLPVAGEVAATAPQARETRPARGAPRRILVIEDNVDAGDSLREALLFGEHAVQVARDGREGLERARQFGPEVVLCDIGLPLMDGYAVAQQFRADPELRSAFLVALTGYTAPEDLARAKAAGFDAHLAKPPSLEALDRILAGARTSPAREEEHANVAAAGDRASREGFSES